MAARPHPAILGVGLLLAASGCSAATAPTSNPSRVASRHSRVATACAATAEEAPAVIPELSAHVQGEWKRCSSHATLFAPDWVGKGWISADGSRLVVDASST